VLGAVYPLAHERRYAASLLNVILAANVPFAAVSDIRERQGLAYAIESDLSPYTDSACSRLRGISRESAAATDSFGVRRISQRSGQKESHSKNCARERYLKGSMMLSLESTSARMSNLARQTMYLTGYFAR